MAGCWYIADARAAAEGIAEFQHDEAMRDLSLLGVFDDDADFGPDDPARGNAQ